MKKRSSPKRAPKKLQAVQTSRHFRIAHHKHTGRIVPRHGTSYPLLAMIVLCVGVFLTSWTQMVEAWPDSFPGSVSNSYDVHVRVPSPAPTVAATIDNPINGKVFREVPVTVGGSCPLNTYVQLMRNNIASGVAICQANGKYDLETDLFEGANELVARVHSSTDLPGPDSESITVYYRPVQPQPPTAPRPIEPEASNSGNKVPVQSGQSAVILPDPLIIKSKFAYQGYYINEFARWEIEIAGGSGPYAMAVDWGDGEHDLYSRTHGGKVVLQHKYLKPGGYKGSYIIRINLSDSEGRRTSLQLLSIINNPPTAVANSTAGTPDGLAKGIDILASGTLGKLVKYIWPSYFIVVLMLISFWLGERREYHLLKPRLRKARHA